MKTVFSDDKGFSLIEIIASVLLIGVISFSIGMGIVQAINGYAFAKQNTQTLQKGQSAMARLAKEFNAITYISSSPAPDLAILQFSTTLSGVDKMAISFSGSDLLIQINGNPPDVLTDKVRDFKLKYYDSFDFSGTPPQPYLLSPPAVPSSVKIIEIELILIGANNSDAVFKDRVVLRNLLN